MRHATLIFALILMAACSSATRQPPATGRLKASRLGLQAILDNRLRELMADMNTLILSEKEMNEHQKDIERREYNLKMAQSAESMSKTVDDILACLPLLKLIRTEQTNFLALADKLRRDSTDLRDMAVDNQTDAIPGQLDRIDVTCKACHQLFRTAGD